MGKFGLDNTPVVDKEVMMDRLARERAAIIKMQRLDGLPVKSMLNYWSDSTFECHCFPVFLSDKPIDIVNRYTDLFPREYKNFVEEVKDINATLYNPNGMSKEKINMAKLKVPVIVYKALQTLDEDFWIGDKGIKWIEQNVKPFKVGK